MTDALRLEIEAGVARISIARPEKRNAIDQSMWEAFPKLVEAAASDTSVRVIEIGSASPGIFCAGADIAEFREHARDPRWQAANRAAIRATQVAVARAPTPTVAIVDGDCVGGGCGLALACDIRIASTRARFGITPARLGLVYPLHDTKLLVDLVGPGQAKRMLYTGELLSAVEAFEIGLVEKVATVDELPEAAERLRAAILAASPFSTRGIKETVGRILAGVADDDAQSVALFDAAFAGPDFAEGVAAFTAKRKPDFADR